MARGNVICFCFKAYKPIKKTCCYRENRSSVIAHLFAAYYNQHEKEKNETEYKEIKTKFQYFDPFDFFFHRTPYLQKSLVCSDWLFRSLLHTVHTGSVMTRTLVAGYESINHSYIKHFYFSPCCFRPFYRAEIVAVKIRIS